MKTPILETERLILRPLNENDAEDVFAWTSDAEVNEYMIYLPHKSSSFTREWLSKLDNENDNSYTFGYLCKETNQLIGSGGIYYHSDTDNWHVGYNLRKDAWNKGYATEAMKRIIAFAHEKLGAKDFASEHAVENIASGKVLEKCGFRFCGDGTFTKADGSRVFSSKQYSMRL